MSWIILFIMKSYCILFKFFFSFPERRPDPCYKEAVLLKSNFIKVAMRERERESRLLKCGILFHV